MFPKLVKDDMFFGTNIVSIAKAGDTAFKNEDGFIQIQILDTIFSQPPEKKFQNILAELTYRKGKTTSVGTYNRCTGNGSILEVPDPTHRRKVSVLQTLTYRMMDKS
jgi:hypothetical protein